MTILLALTAAIVLHVQEGDVQAFPSLLDASGHVLADGRFTQRIEGDSLHIEARYDFADGRIVEEKATLRLRPSLEQRSWEWSERGADGEVSRKFAVDFASGHATGRKGRDQLDEHLDVHPGRTFAGIALVVAVKNLRHELARGSSADLEVVAFTPKPRTVGLEVRRDGPDELLVAGRRLATEKWTLHPKVPAIAKLFVHADDQHVWLFRDDPPALLRFEGPLMEPSDPVIRVETIPSAAANVRRGRRAAPRTDRARAATPPARR